RAGPVPRRARDRPAGARRRVRRRRGSRPRRRCRAPVPAGGRRRPVPARRRRGAPPVAGGHLLRAATARRGPRRAAARGRGWCPRGGGWAPAPGRDGAAGATLRGRRGAGLLIGAAGLLLFVLSLTVLDFAQRPTGEGLPIDELRRLFIDMRGWPRGQPWFTA